VNVDAITDGIVLDHIQAGCGMAIFQALELENLGCAVAVIMNVKSRKMGCKDIIKCDGEAALALDVDAIGYIDQNITVNLIRHGELVEKRRLTLPKTLKNVIRCKNPRCITTTEPGINQLFRLTDNNGKPIYRCAYCEMSAK